MKHAFPHILEGPQSSPISTVRIHSAIFSGLNSGHLILEIHNLAFIIAKKTMDENRFKMHKRQQIAHHLVFKMRTEFTLKINNWKMGLDVESHVQDCLY